MPAPMRLAASAMPKMSKMMQMSKMHVVVPAVAKVADPIIGNLRLLVPAGLAVGGFMSIQKPNQAMKK